MTIGRRKGDFGHILLKCLKSRHYMKRLALKPSRLWGLNHAFLPMMKAITNLKAKGGNYSLICFIEISAEPSIVGASRHLMYIGRK
jgi:hypothetical protein